jgi:hypothetical protein
MILNSTVFSPLLDAPARAGLHRAAARVGLHAAAPAAAAARAVDAHDHVAELAGRAAPGPRPAVEHEPAADARAPEDAEQRPVLARRADLELRVRRQVDVVAERDRHLEVLLERLAQVERARPARQVHRARDRALGVVDAARRADADAREVGGGEPRLIQRLAQHLRHPRGDRFRPAFQRRLVALGPQDFVARALVHDRRLDLRAAEIDPAVERHR